MAQQPLAPANSPLDRFFNAQQQRTTPSASILNLGIGGAGAGPQPPVAAPNLYNMSALQQQQQQQQAQQTQQAQQQPPQQQQQPIGRSPLLSALLMNQAQPPPPQPQNAQPMIGQFPQFQTHIPLFQQQQSNHVIIILN